MLGFFSSSAMAQPCESKLILAEHETAWIGCISKEAVTNFKENANASAKTLLIQSEGGDVEAAIDLAKEIIKRKISVVVRGYCYSSCANYILPSGRQVYVEPGSRVLFHGDAKITLNRIGHSDWIEPLLLTRLTLTVRSEDNLILIMPKGAIIQLAQRIALSGKDVIVHGTLNGMRYECNGMDLPYWVPTVGMLRTLGIVDAENSETENYFKDLPARIKDFGIDLTPSPANPLAHCKKTLLKN